MCRAARLAWHAEEAQTAHPAVRIDAESHTRSNSGDHFGFKNMSRVSLELDPGQNFFASFGFERATLWKIALEMERVHFYPADFSVRGELDQGPLVNRAPAPAGRPCL